MSKNWYRPGTKVRANKSLIGKTPSWSSDARKVLEARTVGTISHEKPSYDVHRYYVTFEGCAKYHWAKDELEPVEQTVILI